MPVVVEQNFKIAGTGSYLPQHAVSAEEIDLRTGLPTGWCRKHVGIETRYECRAPEDLVSMGAKAISIAMLDANLQWTDIDAIIDCSTSQYRPIPCNAVHFQNAIAQTYPECLGVPCFDINSTCLGSIIAIHLINSMFSSNSYRNIVLVASESGMGGVNLQQPESSGLIGDGAAAIVLSKAQYGNKMIFQQQTFSQHLELCKVEGGGHKLPVFEYTEEKKHEFQFAMDGPAVFKVALRHLKPMVLGMREALASLESVQAAKSLHYLPHQASPKALRAVRCQLKVPQDRFHIAVHEVGNLVAASIPFMLDRTRKNGNIACDDYVMLLGTSAGYSQAGLIFRV